MTEPGWVRVQKKTFTRWANRFLAERMMVIRDLKTDLCDGVLLINLMELISSEKLGRYNKTARMAIQKRENIVVALNFIKSKGIKLVNTGPGDVEEGNEKIIMGLMWSIILRFQITMSTDDASDSPKKTLLDWVNKQIAPYKGDGVQQVTNFTTSFTDGKALAALVDSLQPGCMDMRNLGAPLSNCTTAVNTADEKFEIPPIIDPEDIVKNPDEHSMMTYISYFRDYVENADKRKSDEEAARRRAAEEEARRKAAAVARALMWKAEGPGVTSGCRDRWLPFTVSSSNANAAPANASEFVVIIECEGDKFMGEIRESSAPGVFDAKYKTSKLGTHLVSITLGGEPIANSPYSVPIREGAVAALSHAEGPGLSFARDDQPAVFTVYCKDKEGKPVAGEDSLEVTVESDDGKQAAAVDVKDNKDGSYSVSYRAKQPGNYTILVSVDKKPIKDMPVGICVQSGKDLDGLCKDIDGLRKNLELQPRNFTDEELGDAHAVDNLTKERDDLRDVDGVVKQIQDLRKQLDMEPRVFTEEELTGPNAYPDRCAERDELAKQLAMKNKTGPLVEEIQKIRKNLDLDPRNFTENELFGPTAYEDRLKERDDLKSVQDLVDEIQRLRKAMDLPPRQFTEEELTGPNAVANLTKERDHLVSMLPVHDEIHDLRKKLEMTPRDFQEEELTGPQSMPDRVKERDGLRDMWRRKQLCDPLCAEIQALRKGLEMPPRDFSFEDVTGPTSVQDRTAERDHLKKITPIVDEIADLREKLGMEPREYKEEELTGPTSVPDREKERDELKDRLAKKTAVDPLVAEIQKLRQEKLDLGPREFSEDELWGDDAVKDRRKERDDLKTVIPLVQQIGDLRKQLDMPAREYEEKELTNDPNAIPDRTAERDELLDKLGEKMLIDPLVAEIQALRKKMELDPRVFTEEELTGPTAVKDRLKERDDLRAMLDLFDQIQDLRKQLEWPRREFVEDELTGKTSYPDRVDERDDLLDRLARKHQTDPLCEEINQLRKGLDLDEKEFTEEEKTGPTAVEDRTEERDNLKEVSALADEIQKLRKQVELPVRQFEEEELCGKDAVPDRTDERDQLKQVVPLAEEICDLHRKLGMPDRVFEEDELTGSTAVPDRTDERDGLLEKLARKKLTDPLCAEIQRLRKQVNLPPKEWEEEELTGPTAVEDRTQERDTLKDVVPLANEIHKLRRQLEMPIREFEEDELCGETAVPDRTEERDNLLNQFKQRGKVDPLIAEIQRLRKRLDLPPREFTDEELNAPSAEQDLTDERDQLKNVTPLFDEIHSLHKKLEMPAREFEEPELTDQTNAIPDRTEERDRLKDLLAKKRLIDPLLRQIQKLRKQLDLPEKTWTEEELTGDTAVEDRTKERDDLKEVVPLEAQIQRLHKKLEMPVRQFEPEELDGPTAVEDRTEERDNLQDRLNRRSLIDPLVREIQKLRKQLDLPPKEFTEDELYGPTAVEDLTKERDDLRLMVPLASDIQKLHKKLDAAPRQFEEEELTGPGTVEDRTYERDRLQQIPPLCDEIQDLRKQLDMPVRKWEDEELVGPTNVEDRTEERDGLLDKVDRRRALQPLIDELQGLRKQLEMDPRVFADGELDADDADVMLQNEIDELKRNLNNRDEADALAAEIQDLRKELDMSPRVFTEEEMDAKDAVPKLTKERDDLRDELERRRAVGDLPEQINRLRKKLYMPEKKFPDPVPIDMVPELIEERDDLQDECNRRRAHADDILPKIDRLWKHLDIPPKDRPDLSLGKDEIPSLPFLDKADKEYERLQNMMKDRIGEDIAKQQALLNKLWDQLHVPDDQRRRFYRNIPNLYSPEGLQALMDEIARLHAQLLASKGLIKLILKRKAFIQKMMEFEVIASDPRRLFKSSVVLNREEEFRKTAYPTLLDLEDKIRAELEAFEEKTGEPFMWEGEYYLVTLEMEIEERPIDPGVFGVGQGKSGRKNLQKTKLAAQKKTEEKKSSSKTAKATSAAGARKTAATSSRPTARATTTKTNLPPGFKTARR